MIENTAQSTIHSTVDSIHSVQYTVHPHYNVQSVRHLAFSFVASCHLFCVCTCRICACCMWCVCVCVCVKTVCYARECTAAHWPTMRSPLWRPIRGSLTSIRRASAFHVCRLLRNTSPAECACACVCVRVVIVVICTVSCVLPGPVLCTAHTVSWEPSTMRACVCACARACMLL
jgi:hypothetical protein